MDVSAIGGALANISLLGPGAANTAALQSFSGHAGMAGQPGINLNALSLSSNDTLMDGVRSSISAFIDKSNRLKSSAGTSGTGSDLVKTIEPQEIAVSAEDSNPVDKGQQAALDNLRSVYEYAANVALVTNVVSSIGRGISTLTSKGG